MAASSLQTQTSCPALCIRRKYIIADRKRPQQILQTMERKVRDRRSPQQAQRPDHSKHVRRQESHTYKIAGQQRADLLCTYHRSAAPKAARHSSDKLGAVLPLPPSIRSEQSGSNWKPHTPFMNIHLLHSILADNPSIRRGACTSIAYARSRKCAGWCGARRCPHLQQHQPTRRREDWNRSLRRPLDLLNS